MRRFTQTFVLAIQAPKTYYVHNDIFRYQDLIFPDEEEADVGGVEGSIGENNEREVEEGSRSEPEEDEHHNQAQKLSTPTTATEQQTQPPLIPPQQPPLQQQQPMYYAAPSQAHVSNKHDLSSRYDLKVQSYLFIDHFRFIQLYSKF